jgi:peptide-methionine (S)-S-oxide reductase
MQPTTGEGAPMPDVTPQTAIIGGGCFWCLEAVFEQLRGVLSVESGYAGGHTAKPTYQQVCGGNTGHAEVVRITFDPTVITFRELLEVFFTTHDPTTLNRQGNDIGTQYRSVIFCQNSEQRATAESVIAELTADHVFPSPIVTDLAGPAEFYKAEDYHQGYYRANPGQGYCQAVVSPKVAKLRSKFAAKLK